MGQVARSIVSPQLGPTVVHLKLMIRWPTSIFEKPSRCTSTSQPAKRGMGTVSFYDILRPRAD